MPNRIIKESICTSDNIDQLSPFQEIVFYRLMVNCDDFGRFDARVKLLCSRLFPLRDIDPEDMQQALQALVIADLISIYTVDGKPYLQMKTWDKHQQRRSDKSKYPNPSDSDPEQDDINCNQMISNDINRNQAQENDIKCPRNRDRNRNTLIDNRYRYTGDDDAAHKIAEEHNRVLDAAEDAGFLRSNSVRAKLIDLYAVHGLDKVLAGIASCVQHGVINLAYLEAVLKGEPKKPKGNSVANPNTAQNYEQRDYSGEDNRAMDEMLERIKQLKEDGA